MNYQNHLKYLYYKKIFKKNGNINKFNFDWEKYIDKYSDLKLAGINTKEKAWKHWINYGFKENRECYKINKSNINSINNKNIIKDIVYTNSINNDNKHIIKDIVDTNFIDNKNIIKDIVDTDSINNDNENIIKDIVDTDSINNDNENIIKDTNFIKNNNEDIVNNIKFSIIIPYYNKKNQIELTLNGFEKYYSKYNIEVIIGDDKNLKKDNINDIINNYSFPIKIIKLLDNNIINPTYIFNSCLSHIEGDIIILQSSEECSIHLIL